MRIKLARKGVVRKPSKSVTVHPNDEGKEVYISVDGYSFHFNCLCTTILLA